MNRASPCVVAGLGVALGGPLLLSLVAARLVARAGVVAGSLIAYLVMWALLVAVVTITLKGEIQPLSSLGVRRRAGWSLFWGLVAAAALIYCVIPLSTALVAATGLSGFEQGLSQVLALPLWLRVVAVATAAVVEEVLYRGYAITRLEAVTGSQVFAAVVSVLIFALAHWPLWGPGPVLAFVLSGGFLAAWFLWRRDLVANIVAHAVVDSMGLVFLLASV